MYPSISVCKKWAFDLATLDFEGYSNETVSTFIGWLNEYSVRMEDQFYFFTLPGLKNLTFPCTTTLGGMTPGRPCAFPIYWFGKFKDKCFYMGTQSPACLTKRPTGGNISDYFDHSQDYFGYCQANCSGEMPGPNSPYNLASSKHKQYWYSFFYDLSSYENGYCHTFNPPQKSVPGMENRMYFMINNISAYSTSYDVFLHERGQFWPRSDMFSLGQSEPVQVELHSDVEIIFTHQKIARLNSQSRPCIDSLDYSFTKCIQNFAVRKTNCSIDYSSVGKDQQELCSKENFFRYFKLLIWIKQGRLSEVIKESGCHPKCVIKQYSFETIHERSSWTPNWTAEVYIQPKSSIVEYSSEYYTFDFNALVGNIGGYLGLFLGWSFLTFVEVLAFILCMFKVNKK